MKASHRTALSLLLTIIIFAAISLAAVFGGFRYVEMHYYQPRVVNNITKTLDSIGKSYDQYADSLAESFAEYVLDSRAATFIERDVTASDIEEREKMTGNLMEKKSGLEGIRLVEGDGVHVHYSTYQFDVLSKSEDLIAYRDYNELNEIPIQFLAVADNGEYSDSVEKMVARSGIYFDSVRERVIFSFPYFDRYTAYRGTILFYVGSTEFVSQIIADNVVPLNTRLKIVAPVEEDSNTQSSGNSGFVFGMPNVGRDIISKSVLKSWESKRYGAEQIVQTEDGEVLILVTGSQCSHGKIGWICRDSEFSFSETEKVLLLLCLFITVFLIIFMLFNFRHDDSVVIRERVHKFEMALFREYLEHRDTEDWKALEKKISQRKQDVNAEIVKSLGLTGKKHSKEITEALDRSWNDFMHLVSGGYRATLENLSAQPPVHSVAEVVPVQVMDVQQLPEADGLEDLEEIPDAEDVEELSDVEPVDEVEELEPEAQVNVDVAMKTNAVTTDDIRNGDIEELEELSEDEDLEVPVVEDFVDPLENEPSFAEVAEPDELEEISPEEEAQLAQVEAQAKKNVKWFNNFLSDEEMGTPSFEDLDSEDDTFWGSKDPSESGSEK